MVRVPTPEQEQERSISRQRESFQRQKQRLAAQGRSHALYYGEPIQGEWWQQEVWKTLAAQLPPIVVHLLEPLRRLIAVMEVELKTRIVLLVVIAVIAMLGLWVTGPGSKGFFRQHQPVLLANELAVCAPALLKTAV